MTKQQQEEHLDSLGELNEWVRRHQVWYDLFKACISSRSSELTPTYTAYRAVREASIMADEALGIVDEKSISYDEESTPNV